MADNSTKIVLTAQDNASPVLAQAGKNMLSLGQAADMVKSQVGAIGAGLTIAGFGALVADTVKAAGALHDMAQQTGATVEALSGIAPVAKLSDTSMEQVGSAIQKLSKHMLEAQTGSKDQAAYFKALGVSITDTSGQLRDSGTVFQDVAKQIAAIASPTERVAAAQLAFGKSGAQLLPLLQDLATAGELVVKTTSAQAALADNIGDNWKRLGMVYQGTGKIIAMEMLPALDAMTTAALNFANGTTGIKASAKDLAADGTLKQWAQDSAMAIGYLVNVIQGVQIAFAATGKSLAAVAGMAFAKTPQEAKAIREAFGEDMDKLTGQKQFTDLLRESFAGIGKAASSAAPQVTDFSKRLAAMQDGGKAQAELMKQQFANRLEAIKEGLAAEEQVMKIARARGEIDERQYLDAITEAQRQSYVDRASALRDQLAQASDPKDREKLFGEIQKLGAEAAKSASEATLAYIALDKAAQKALDTLLSEAWQNTGSLSTDTQKLREEYETLGLTTDQLARYRVEKLRAAQESNQLFAQAVEEAAAAIEGEGAEVQRARDYYIELAKAKRAAADQLGEQAVLVDMTAAKQQAVDAAKDSLKAWENFARDVEQSLTDALMRSFEAGDGFGEAFAKNLVNTFKTMVLKLAVQAVVTPVMGQLQGLLGIPQAQGASGSAGGLLNAASGANNLYNFATGGGMLSGFSAGAASVASELALGSAFVGPSATLAGGAVGAGATAAAATGSAGAAGAISSVASAMPYVGAALAIGGALGLFGGDKPDPKVGLTNSRTQQKNSVAQSPFGWLGLRMDEMDEGQTKAAQKIVQQLAGLDSTIADSLKGFELSKVKTALGDWKAKMADYSGGALRKQGFDRLRIINEQIDSWVADAVEEIIYADRDAMKGADYKEKYGYGKNSKQALANNFNIVDTLYSVRDEQGFEQLVSSLVDGGAEAFKAAGETTNDALVRMVKSLDTVNDRFDLMGRALFDISTAGANAASNLVDAFGSLDQFNAGMATYYDLFYSGQEKATAAVEALAAQFDDLGVSLPASKDAFRSLVESISLTTASGRELYASLIGLAPAFAMVTESARAVAFEAADNALGALSRSVDAEIRRVQQTAADRAASLDTQIDAQNIALTAAQDLVSEVADLVNQITDAAEALRASAGAGMSVDQGRAALDAMLVSAQAGFLPETDALESAVTALLSDRPDNYATATDFKLAQLQQAAKLDQLNALAALQQSSAEDAVDYARRQLYLLEDQKESVQAAAEAQIEALRAQVDNARQQLDALKGIDGRLLSVGEALAVMTTAINNIKINITQQVQQTSAYTAPTYEGYQVVSSSTQRGETGINVMSPSGTKTVFIPDSQNMALRKYDVGTAYVPQDMTAQIHQGEIIIDPKSSAILRKYGIGMALANTGGTDENLRAEVAALRADLRTALGVVASNTRQSKELLDSVVNGANTLRTEVIA